MGVRVLLFDPHVNSTRLDYHGFDITPCLWKIRTMVAIITSAVSVGLTTQELIVEVDIGSGLPAVTIVGLPDKAVNESKERIRSAIKSNGFDFPLGRITINLAPADKAKSGSGLDLPIALGILTHMQKIPSLDRDTVVVGELSLNGELRAVPGILNILLWAQKAGKKRLFIPEESAHEVLTVEGITILPVAHLSQLVQYMNGVDELITPLTVTNSEQSLQSVTSDIIDFSRIKGQVLAKRALLIAAAGGHNVLLVGDPGTGKTLLSRAFPGILPVLSEPELLEVNSIYSAAGLLQSGKVLKDRPFRSPHHTSSHISIVGGGTNLRPGEVTLAHRGVLFLDEFAEFKRETLEALRQPIEDGIVTIARASGVATYPARFILLAAANPTPSGSFAEPSNSVSNDIRSRRYREKFSGPLMDRIDIHVRITKEARTNTDSSTTATLRKQVEDARKKQSERYTKLPYTTNSELTAAHIAEYSFLQREAEELLNTAQARLDLSMRAVHRVIKVARTIADLAMSDEITPEHIAEALQFRAAALGG